MNALVTDQKRMAGRKKENYDRGRVEFKATPEWILRADRMAKEDGHGNLSSFIRFAVTQYMEQRELEKRAGRKGKS
jgi:hypothetical protein